MSSWPISRYLPASGKQSWKKIMLEQNSVRPSAVRQIQTKRGAEETFCARPMCQVKLPLAAAA
jgi:hypothetical protein